MQSNIDKVATALSRRQRFPELRNEKMKTIETGMQKFFLKFDSEIAECKKYNEAKIHRKYQSIIDDLKEEVRTLSERVQIEQQSRSPSKRYVQELLDQLVMYKNQNQKLKIHIKEMEIEMGKMRAKVIDQQDNNFVTDEGYKETTFQEYQQQDLTIKIQLKAEVKKYLKKKLKQRKTIIEDKTPFNKYLKKWVQSQQLQGIDKFLEGIDRWSEGVNLKKQQNDEKKSRILSTFEVQKGYFSINSSKSRLKTMAQPSSRQLPKITLTQR